MYWLLVGSGWKWFSGLQVYMHYVLAIGWKWLEVVGSGFQVYRFTCIMYWLLVGSAFQVYRFTCIIALCTVYCLEVVYRFAGLQRFIMEISYKFNYMHLIPFMFTDSQVQVIGTVGNKHCKWNWNWDNLKLIRG